jgi:hypothetical protein
LECYYFHKPRAAPLPSSIRLRAAELKQHPPLWWSSKSWQHNLLRFQRRIIPAALFASAASTSRASICGWLCRERPLWRSEKRRAMSRSLRGTPQRAFPTELAATNSQSRRGTSFNEKRVARSRSSRPHDRNENRHSQGDRGRTRYRHRRAWRQGGRAEVARPRNRRRRNARLNRSNHVSLCWLRAPKCRTRAVACAFREIRWRHRGQSASGCRTDAGLRNCRSRHRLIRPVKLREVAPGAQKSRSEGVLTARAVTPSGAGPRCGAIRGVCQGRRKVWRSVGG